MGVGVQGIPARFVLHVDGLPRVIILLEVVIEPQSRLPDALMQLTALPYRKVIAALALLVGERFRDVGDSGVEPVDQGVDGLLFAHSSSRAIISRNRSMRRVNMTP